MLKVKRPYWHIEVNFADLGHQWKPIPGIKYGADPFLLKTGADLWCYYESLPNPGAKGSVSRFLLKPSEISEEWVVDTQEVISESWHLSYPYCWEEEGTIYVLPESASNKIIKIYRLKGDNETFEFYSDVRINDCLLDVNLSKENDWYFLWGTRQHPIDTVGSGILTLYKSASLRGPWINVNPCLSWDDNFSRNAGSSRYGEANEWPGQAFSNDTYGHHINFYRLSCENGEFTKLDSRLQPELGLRTHHLSELPIGSVRDRFY
jgi:hypothetical protein